MALPVAIVTGGGRGIGRAVAIQLSEKGYRLALVSRSQSELQETIGLCKPDGQAAAIPGDVGDSTRVQGIVDETLTRFGRIDVLVHCAGVAPRAPIDQFTLEQWRQTVDVNLSAVVYFCRLLWPIWRRQGDGGVVVNVSSYAAHDPFSGLGPYGAAKAGVNLLGLALSREGQEIGVRVHTVAPAATETAMFRKLMTPEQYPTEKTLDPAEVARVIVDCVSGSLTVTSGEVIYVRKPARN